MHGNQYADYGWSKWKAEHNACRGSGCKLMTKWLLFWWENVSTLQAVQAPTLNYDAISWVWSPLDRPIAFSTLPQLNVTECLTKIDMQSACMLQLEDVLCSIIVIKS
jgi:hypothetical protein